MTFWDKLAAAFNLSSESPESFGACAAVADRWARARLCPQTLPLFRQRFDKGIPKWDTIDAPKQYALKNKLMMDTQKADAIKNPGHALGRPQCAHPTHRYSAEAVHASGARYSPISRLSYDIQTRLQKAGPLPVDDIPELLQRKTAIHANIPLRLSETSSSAKMRSPSQVPPLSQKSSPIRSISMQVSPCSPISISKDQGNHHPRRRLTSDAQQNPRTVHRRWRSPFKVPLSRRQHRRMDLYRLARFREVSRASLRVDLQQST